MDTTTKQQRKKRNVDGAHGVPGYSTTCSMHDGQNSVMVIFTVSVSIVLHCLNKFGETALITASDNGHLETAKLLLQRSALVNYQRKVSVTVCGRCTGCVRQTASVDLTD